MSNIKKYKNLCDLHTHTIYSLHAMSSPTEMVEAAIDKGLKYIGLTDHYYPQQNSVKGPEFNNILWSLNNYARLKDTEALFACLSDKIHVLSGFEYNLFNIESVADISIKNLNIIGFHNWFFKENYYSLEDFGDEICAAIEMERYKMIAHLERGLGIFKDDENFDTKINTIFEKIITLCNQYGVVLEVNEASLHSDDRFEDDKRFKLMDKWLKIAKEHKCDICVNSDSHIKYSVGNINNALSKLEDIDYPIDHIVNFDESKIRHYFVYPRYTPITKREWV